MGMVHPQTSPNGRGPQVNVRTIGGVHDFDAKVRRFVVRDVTIESNEIEIILSGNMEDISRLRRIVHLQNIQNNHSSLLTTSSCAITSIVIHVVKPKGIEIRLVREIPSLIVIRSHASSWQRRNQLNVLHGGPAFLHV